MYKKIFVDQCGYQPQMKKYVTFQAQEPVEFSVLRSDGECVMKGRTDKDLRMLLPKRLIILEISPSLLRRGDIILWQKA